MRGGRAVVSWIQRVRSEFAASSHLLQLLDLQQQVVDRLLPCAHFLQGLLDLVFFPGDTCEVVRRRLVPGFVLTYFLLRAVQVAFQLLDLVVPHGGHAVVERAGRWAGGQPSEDEQLPSPPRASFPASSNGQPGHSA